MKNWAVTTSLIVFCSFTSAVYGQEIEIRAKGQWIIHTFDEMTMSLDYCYAGEEYSSHLISNIPQISSVLDIGADGDLDVILPILRGYRSGLDPRMPFFVFENTGDELVFNEALRENLLPMPGAGFKYEFELANGTNALLTAMGSTQSHCGDISVPWYHGFLSITDIANMEDITEDTIPRLPMSAVNGRFNTIDLHALAVGDLNHDGLNDILVGDRVVYEYDDNYQPYALIQQSDSSLEIHSYDLLRDFGDVWLDPDISDGRGNYLTAFHLADFDQDGMDDLVVGWSNGDAFSRVFWGNESAEVTLDIATRLSPSVYGTDNQMHINQWSFDYDGDEDLDLLVQYLPHDPYYGGQYLHLYELRGREFVDVTDKVLLDGMVFPDQFAEEFSWGEHWYVLDINNDGYEDIVGQGTYDTKPNIYIFINDGTQFEFHEIEFDEGIPVAWGDFDQNGQIEFVSYLRNTVSNDPWRSVMQITHYEISGL